MLLRSLQPFFLSVFSTDVTQQTIICRHVFLYIKSYVYISLFSVIMQFLVTAAMKEWAVFCLSGTHLCWANICWTLYMEVNAVTKGFHWFTQFLSAKATTCRTAVSLTHGASPTRKYKRFLEERILSLWCMNHYEIHRLLQYCSLYLVLTVRHCQGLCAL